MTTETVSAAIDGHSCCIDGVIYMFSVRLAVMEPDPNPALRQVFMEVHAVRADVPLDRVVAKLRFRVPLTGISQLPQLLPKALQHFLTVTTIAPTTIH